MDDDRGGPRLERVTAWYVRRATEAYDGGDWRWFSLQLAILTAPVLLLGTAIVVLALGVERAWIWLALTAALEVGLITAGTSMVVVRRRSRRRRDSEHRRRQHP